MPATTVYSFHAATDHKILDTATPGDLQTTAARIADTLHRARPTDAENTAHRVYVHNGLGVIGAGLCRNGLWHDVLRDDYRQFDEAARTRRAARNLEND